MARLAHAVALTFVDRNDSGNRELALGHFTSAAAGGFVGMAYLHSTLEYARPYELRVDVIWTKVDYAETEY